MPYKISNTLASRLPEGERDTPEAVGKFLFDRDSGVCWLCDGQMHVASEELEADHDRPEAEGGSTTLANLHLVHQSCNRSKKNLTTAQIRPYLRLRRFIKSMGGRCKYGDLTVHFGITPRPSMVKVHDAWLQIELPNSGVSEAPIFSESTADKTWTFAFAEVPREAIFNDDQVQPRNVRYDHAFLIYGDLLKNPLHEPPSCRLGSRDKQGLTPLLMFDGQHKTVASWMADKKTVVVKLYLDMDEKDAIFLVNSIQSKIKKLPLSSFELAGKMADEWRNKVEQYEQATAEIGEQASEAGYLKWVPAGSDRNRGKAAFKSALIQNALDDPDLRLVQHVLGEDTPVLTETMVKSKILDKMISFEPLTLPFYDSTSLRGEETENIVWLWNSVIDEFLTEGKDDQERELKYEARRRLFKQESLEHVSQLLAQLFRHKMYKDANDPILSGTPNEPQKQQIEAGILNICADPVWTASFDRDARMLAVGEALSKNQGGRQAFEGVALKFSYVLLGHRDLEFDAYWKKA